MRTFYILLLMCFFSLNLLSQNDNTSVERDITQEWIQTRQKRLEDSQLPEEDKKKLQEIYNQMSDYIKKTENLVLKEKDFANHTTTAPNREVEFRDKINQLQKELEKPVFARSDFKDLAFAKISLSDLEKKLAQLRTERDSLKGDVATLHAELEYRNNRRLEIPKLLLEIKKNIESYQLSTEKSDTNSIQTANNILTMLIRKSLIQEHTTYEKEIASYDARNNLINLRKEHMAKRQLLLEQNINTLTNEIAQRKKIEAEEAAQQAREALLNVIRSHPVIKKLTAENANLTERRKQILKNITMRIEYIKTVEKTLKDVQLEINRTKEKATAAHLTNVMGILLRQQLYNLPHIHENKQQVIQRQYELPATQLAIIELEEKLLELANFEKAKASYAAQFANDVANYQNYLQTLEEVLTNRRAYIQNLVTDYNTYLSKLIDLDTKERFLISTVNEYRTYIEEHIFWEKSTDAFRVKHISKIFSAIQWLFSPANWWKICTTILIDARENILLYIVFFIVLAFLIYVRWSIYQQLDDITKLISRKRTDQFKHTLYVCFYTLVVASTVPIIMWSLGWRLEKAPSLFAIYTGQALKATTKIYFLFSLSYAICMVNGLGEAHFRWPVGLTAFIRKSIRFFMWPLVTLYFFVFIIENHNIWQDSLGRLFFSFSMIVGMIFFFRIFHHYRTIFPLHTKPLHKIIYYVAFFSTVILPIFLIVISFIGYHYTSIHLSEKILQSIAVSLLIFYVGNLLLRWLEVIYHKFVYLQRKATEKKEAENHEENTNEAPLDTHAVENLQLETSESSEEAIASYNLEEFKNQGKYLVSILQWLAVAVCLWLIWRDVLPALKMLNRIVLWSYTIPGGEEVTSLKDLIYAIIALVVTSILAKNLPTLLEIYFLQKIKLENGVSFAVSTLIRYTLVTVGVIIACQSIGLNWGKVQWLVAAFSVGLGFGLQEIFANFVAGLIILFERPMRVGDIVTVGETSGKVSKIKIRATTITDWDRKELIVPNKEFITGRLVNWSLSDTTLRIVVDVGVAYGSDVEKVRQTLIEVAQSHPDILPDEGVTVVFNKFGDSALNFSMRVFIPNISFFLKVIHDLHMTINRTFREKGIEIAFPQRDIHVRSINGANVSKIVSEVKEQQ
ncbi:mechanosensitive ion channel domain-containing protein [Candidatus Uabimicrobium amorphum]|uniref:Potassium transporter n=1 Tax=Uabimicrobium amorphum TaxID=2596890 RepID=A0A5S9IJC4_UABAM|nr:mechanosensitive ion channel domain-containing protein [Candidatus Uabimicrobium amorphum]BBM82581.1 potassium transporter [Candidatus Uabimicrobium amorphum]